MKMSRTLRVSNRDAWRSWLEKHHADASEVWLVHYKKHTGKPRLPYDDAVEEALCFGWIDANIQRIDDDRYARKFTPRRDKSNWSALNLIREGRMTAAGLARLDPAAARPVPAASRSTCPPPLPEYMRKALVANRRAWENFKSLAPSYRRQYIRWVRAAVREETRERRLREAVARLAQNQKLGMK